MLDQDEKKLAIVALGIMIALLLVVMAYGMWIR